MADLILAIEWLEEWFFQTPLNEKTVHFRLKRAPVFFYESQSCSYITFLGGTNLDQLEDLVTPEVGINTFQIDMAGEHKLTDKEMMAAMDKISGLGGLAMLYAENGAIIQVRITTL